MHLIFSSTTFVFGICYILLFVGGNNIESKSEKQDLFKKINWLPLMRLINLGKSPYLQ